MATTKREPIAPRFWHWPDHGITKTASRGLREEHNDAVNQIHELRAALLLVAAADTIEAAYSVASNCLMTCKTSEVSK